MITNIDEPIAGDTPLSGASTDTVPLTKAEYQRNWKKKNRKRLRSYDASRRVGQTSKAADIQTKCGFPDRGFKILSDFEVDVGVRYFWDKRGKTPPKVDISLCTWNHNDLEELMQDEITTLGSLAGYHRVSHRRME